MKGFFDREVPVVSSSKQAKGRVLSCTSCGMYKYVLSPRMEPYGNNKRGIMVIGEAPGEEEDRRGQPWQGKAGKVLQGKYRELGVDLFEDCVCLNAVHCRPVDDGGSNRAPSDYEVACCRETTLAAIKQYQPKVIILHGNVAVQSLITGHRWPDRPTGITAWRGWTIPDTEFNAWVCPTFHPSYIERLKNSTDGGAMAVWTQDIKAAIECVDQEFPTIGDPYARVSTNLDTDETLMMLLKMRPEFLSFDIETTGLKPYNRSVHSIVCVSFCPNKDRAYSIPFPTSERGLKILKRLLEHPSIGKIAANMKFEDTWMKVLHDINVSPWAFDTMQAAHILDNRPGITGLKFQSYVNFGITHYGKTVAAYLDSPDENTPNKLRDIRQSPSAFSELLLYCGMDSLITHWLAMKQMKLLGWRPTEW